MPTVTRIELSDGGVAPSAEYPWSVSGTVNVGDVVALSSSAPKTVIRADADNASARPPIGICIGRSGSLAQVALNGEIASGLSGLTRGSVYYLSTTAGALTSTAPGSNIYPVGIATSATELLVDSSQADLAGGGGGGGGSVTSFGVTTSDFAVSNSPVTTSGNVGLALNTVGVAKGGTGLTSAGEQGAMLYGSSSSAYVAQAVSPTFKNRIINGGMEIAQRGTAAVSANGAYPVDRFQVTNNVTNTFTAQYNSSVYPSGFSSSLLYTVGASGSPSGTLSNRISQAVEGNSVSDLGWGTAQARTITLSFWAKTSVPGTYSISVRNAASVPRYSYISEYTLSSTNWEKKSITILGSQSGLWMTDNGVGLFIDFTLAAGPDYRTSSVNTWLSGLYVASNNQTQLSQTTGATFYLTGIQLEAGSVATEFELRPQQVELALCQRYYQRLASTATAAPAIASGVNISTVTAYFYLKYAQAMRALPTLNNSILGDNGTFLINQVPVYWASTKGTMYYGDNSILMTFGRSAGGLVSGAASVLRLINTGGQGYLELSAEL